MRDYDIDPDDPGKFLTSWEVRGDPGEEREISSTAVKGGSIYTYDKPKENPHSPLRYFCRVGGGFQGFAKRGNALKFERQPL